MPPFRVDLCWRIDIQRYHAGTDSCSSGIRCSVVALIYHLRPCRPVFVLRMIVLGYTAGFVTLRATQRGR